MEKEFTFPTVVVVIVVRFRVPVAEDASNNNSIWDCPLAENNDSNEEHKINFPPGQSEPTVGSQVHRADMDGKTVEVFSRRDFPERQTGDTPCSSH